MENNDGYSWRIPPPNFLNTSCSMVPTTGKSPGKTMLSRGVSYLMDGIVTETKRNDSNMVIYWGEHGWYLGVSENGAYPKMAISIGKTIEHVFLFREQVCMGSSVFIGTIFSDKPTWTTIFQVHGIPCCVWDVSKLIITIGELTSISQLF